MTTESDYSGTCHRGNNERSRNTINAWRLTMDETCVWFENETDGIWETACKQEFEFFEGGPSANGFAFCPFCGKQILVAPVSKEVDDD